MVTESIEAGSEMLIVRGGAMGSAFAVAGCAHLRILEEEAEILHLAVAPDCQRRGLGGFLLRRAMGECAGRGVKSLFLEVRAGNLVARALYGRAGFVDVGLRARYYRDGEDARVMRLALAFPLPAG